MDRRLEWEACARVWGSEVVIASRDSVERWERYFVVRSSE